jgi:hypothetical protein
VLSIGIDPGLDGAVAAIDRTGMGHVWDMPVLSLGGKTQSGAASSRRVLDRRGLKAVLCNALLLSDPAGEEIRCTLERQMAFSPPGRKVGATSMFSLGQMYGSLETALAFLEISYEVVMSQRWKAVVLDGTGKDKAAAVAYCQRAYPSVELVPERCRVPADGRADALCMAEFTRRRYAVSQLALPHVPKAKEDA